MSKKLLAAALAAAFLATGGMAKAGDYVTTASGSWNAADSNFLGTPTDPVTITAETGILADSGSAPITASLGSVGVTINSGGLFVGTKKGSGTVSDPGGVTLTLGAVTLNAGSFNLDSNSTVSTGAFTIADGTSITNNGGSAGDFTVASASVKGAFAYTGGEKITVDGAGNVTNDAASALNASDLLAAFTFGSGGIVNTGKELNVLSTDVAGLGILVTTGATDIGTINLTSNNYTGLTTPFASASAGTVKLAAQTGTTGGIDVGVAALQVNGGTNLGDITATSVTLMQGAAAGTKAGDITGPLTIDNNQDNEIGGVTGKVSITANANGGTNVIHGAVNSGGNDSDLDGATVAGGNNTFENTVKGGVAASGGVNDFQGAVSGSVSVSNGQNKFAAIQNANSATNAVATTGGTNTFTGAITGKFLATSGANDIQNTVTGDVEVNGDTTKVSGAGDFTGGLTVGGSGTFSNEKGASGALNLGGKTISNSGTISNAADSTITFGLTGTYTGGGTIANAGKANVDLDNGSAGTILTDVKRNGTIGTVALNGTNLTSAINSLKGATSGKVDTTAFNGANGIDIDLGNGLDLVAGGGTYKNITAKNVTVGGDGAITTLDGTIATGVLTVANGGSGNSTAVVNTTTDLSGVTSIQVGEDASGGVKSVLQFANDKVVATPITNHGVVDVNGKKVTIGAYNGNGAISNNTDATVGLTTSGADAANVSNIVDALIKGTGNTGGAGAIGTLTLDGQIANGSIDWTGKTIANGTVIVAASQNDAGDINVTKSVMIETNGGNFGTITAAGVRTTGDMTISNDYDSALNVNIAATPPTVMGIVDITDTGSIVSGATNDITLVGTNNSIVNKGEINLTGDDTFGTTQDLTFVGNGTNLVNSGEVNIGKNNKITDASGNSDAYILNFNKTATETTEGEINVAADNGDLNDLASMLVKGTTKATDTEGLRNVGEINLNGDLGMNFNLDGDGTLSGAQTGTVTLEGVQSGNESISAGLADVVMNTTGAMGAGAKVTGGTVTFAETAGGSYADAITARDGDVTVNAAITTTGLGTLNSTDGDVVIKKGGTYGAAITATRGDVSITGRDGTTDSYAAIVATNTRLDDDFDGNVTIKADAFSAEPGATNDIFGSVTADGLVNVTGGSFAGAIEGGQYLDTDNPAYDGFAVKTTKADVGVVNAYNGYSTIDDNHKGAVTVHTGDMVSQDSDYIAAATITVSKGDLSSTDDVIASNITVNDGADNTGDAFIFGSQITGSTVNVAGDLLSYKSDNDYATYTNATISAKTADLGSSDFINSDVTTTGKITIDGDVTTDSDSLMMSTGGAIEISGSNNVLLGGFSALKANGGTILKAGSYATIAGATGDFMVERNATYRVAGGDTIVDGEFVAQNGSIIEFSTDVAGDPSQPLSQIDQVGSGTILLGSDSLLWVNPTTDGSQTVFTEEAVDNMDIVGGKGDNAYDRIDNYLLKQSQISMTGTTVFDREGGVINYIHDNINLDDPSEVEDQLQNVLDWQGIGGDRDMYSDGTVQGMIDVADLDDYDLLAMDDQTAFASIIASGVAGNRGYYDLYNRPEAAYAAGQWLNGKDWAGAVEAVTDTVRNFNRAITSRAYNIGHLLGATEYDECGNIIDSCAGYKNRIWAGYTGFWGKNDGRDYDRGYKYDAHGINVGFDRVTSSGVGFGAAFGYSRGDYENRGSFNPGDKSKLNNYSFGLFASYNHASGWFSTLSGTYTYTKYKMNNSFLDGSIIQAQTDRANFHGDSWSLGGKTGFDFRAGSNLTITPTIGVYYYTSRTNRFDTDLGRKGMKYSRHTVEMPIDVTVKYDIAVGCDSTLSLIATGGYAYNFHNKGTKISNFDLGQGTGALIGLGGDNFVKPGRSSWNVGGGAQFRYRNIDFGVHYEYYGRKDYKSHSLNANVGYSF